MKKTVSALSVSATAVVLSLMCGAPAATASPAVEGGDVAVQNGGNTGQVCDVPFGTTKVESPTPEQLVVTAEPGFVIDKICVKAGSDNQGDGVEWIDGNGATTITVSHSSGKKVSHFVAYTASGSADLWAATGPCIPGSLRYGKRQGYPAYGLRYPGTVLRIFGQ